MTYPSRVGSGEGAGNWVARPNAPIEEEQCRHIE
jgi:hypothetical protein